MQFPLRLLIQNSFRSVDQYEIHGETAKDLGKYNDLNKKEIRSLSITGKLSLKRCSNSFSIYVKATDAIVAKYTLVVMSGKFCLPGKFVLYWLFAGKLTPKEVNKMYGALDLGGGSVQITLPMDDKVTYAILCCYLLSVILKSPLTYL